MTPKVAITVNFSGRPKSLAGTLFWVDSVFRRESHFGKPHRTLLVTVDLSVAKGLSLAVGLSVTVTLSATVTLYF